MSKLKKIIFFIISVIISLMCLLLSKYINLVKAQNDLIIMGTSADFPPFEFLKNGEIVGIDVEIANRIAKKMNAKLEIKDVSFDSEILGLTQGDFNFIASGITKTEERAARIGFSDSYFVASQKIVVKDGSPVNCLEDIQRKKIGVQLGTTGDIYCSEQKLGDIIRYNKYTEAITSLTKGMTDALVVDSFTADQIVKNNKGLKIIPGNLTEEFYCIGFRKEDKDLEKTINEVIAEMKQSGELEKIINSYMTPEKEKTETLSVDSKFTNKEYWDYILKGLIVTLETAFFAMILGLLLGTIASILRIISKSKKELKFLNFLVNCYSTVVRGTPVIVQLFVIYYIALAGISKNPIMAAIITLGINSGAYVCEHIRAGINAIDEGQFEAGKALGIPEKTLMLKVIVPQAFKNILPSLAGEGISLIKETAVVGFIGVMDLSLAGKKITSVTFEPVFPLFTVAAIYLTLVVGLTFILNKIERKIKNAQN